MSKRIAATAIIGSALVLSACASQPEQISAAYVSPVQYQGYTCPQIQMEMTRVSRKAEMLRGTLKKKADKDEMQTAASLIFWPTLLFLEGGDGPQATEYAQLKGAHDSLEAVAIQKSCTIAPEPTTPSEPISDTPADSTA